MKILHTSDWHIGVRLYSRTRYDEFEAFLKWLKNIVIDENTDILVISGDVFDTATPGNKAQKLYYNFLRDIAKTNCSHIVIVGGNHDSPTFLNAPSEILKFLNIHIIGQCTENTDDEVFVLENNKDEKIIVCAVPYLRDKDLRTAQAGESFEDKEKKLVCGIRDHYLSAAKRAQTINKDFNNSLPVLATGHLFAAGGKTFEDDKVRDLYIGKIGQVGIDVFPDVFDYVALGHLHIPQKVSKKDNIRYSGSPIPMGFNESLQKKYVLSVEFENKNPVVKEIDIPVFKKLLTIKGDFAEIEEKINELKCVDESIWAEIIYNGKEYAGDLRQRIEELVFETNLDVLRIKNLQIIDSKKLELKESKSLEELSVHDVFNKCLEDNNVDQDLQVQLKELYEEVIFLINQEDENNY